MSTQDWANPFTRLRLGFVWERRLALLLMLVTRLPQLLYRATLYLALRSHRRAYAPYIKELRREGFVRIPSGVLPVDVVLAECDTVLRAGLRDKHSEVSSNKAYLVPLLDGGDYASLPALVDFATSRELVAIVSAYLYSLPILTYLNIWYSPNTGAGAPEGSQLWHLDHESYRQIKVFLFVSDVDLTSGPTQVFSKTQSLAKQKEIRYRLGSENKHISKGLDDLQPYALVGKRGDIAIVDTSACFHKGSDGLGTPRYVATAQYLPAYAFSKNKFSSLKHLRPVGRPFYASALLNA